MSDGMAYTEGAESYPQDGPAPEPFQVQAHWRLQAEIAPGVFVQVEAADVADFEAAVAKVLA